MSIKEKFKNYCPKCYEIVERFEHDLKLNDYAIGRIEKYWSFLKTIYQLLRCFDKVTKRDIENLIIKIDSNVKWSEWTKHDFKKLPKSSIVGFSINP